MNPLLNTIIQRELSKLERLSQADFMLTREQLEALETISRILKQQPPPPEPELKPLSEEDLKTLENVPTKSVNVRE